MLTAKAEEVVKNLDPRSVCSQDAADVANTRLHFFTRLMERALAASRSGGV